MTNEELENLREELRKPAASLTINVDNLSANELQDLKRVINGPVGSVLTKDDNTSNKDSKPATKKPTTTSYSFSTSRYSDEDMLDDGDSWIYRAQVRQDVSTSLFDTIKSYYAKGITREAALALAKKELTTGEYFQPTITKCLDYFFPADGVPTFVKENRPAPNTLAELEKECAITTDIEMNN
jgi:hypothetical protein